MDWNILLETLVLEEEQMNPNTGWRKRQIVNLDDETDIVYRLRKRAEIRRQIPGRKSVQEGKPDRIADILEEAASEIESLRNQNLS
jgi:signal recognition particle subunit SEC65